MRKKLKIRQWTAWALAGICAIILLGEFAVGHRENNTEQAAARFEKVLASRMHELDGFMDEAFAADVDKWMNISGLPSDMVIYKYIDDTLKFWSNQFTINNDNLTSDQVRVASLVNPRAEPVSVLEYASEKPQLLDMGSKWYLVKAREVDNVRVIGGLVVIDDIDGLHQNGTNPRLHLGGNFIIQTLDAAGQVPVCVDGEPVMLLYCNVSDASLGADVYMLWVALMLFIIALTLMLGVHRHPPGYILSVLLMLAGVGAMYFFGAHAQEDRTLFSPALYANGQFFYSLGALLLVNLAFFLVILFTYICRRPLLRSIFKRKRAEQVAVAVLFIIAAVAVMIYVTVLLRNVIQNSNICLELYKLGSLSWYSLLIYISFISLMIGALLHVRMAYSLFAGRIVDGALPRPVRLSVAVCAALYLVVLAGAAGFDKERSRQAVWASRLSMTRNVALELQLRSVENSIANDAVIAGLSGVNGAEMLILNRIAENYLQRAAQNYNMQVLLIDSSDQSAESAYYLQARMQDAVPVSDNSRFYYTITPSASTIYTGVFPYYNRSSGIVYLMLEVMPKSTHQNRGYASLLELSSPGQVILPASFSFARYSEKTLVSYRGNFDYPTYLRDSFYNLIFLSGQGSFKEDGYTHFVNRIDDRTAILISRPSISVFSFFIAVLFLSVLLYQLLSVISLRPRRRRSEFSSNYYRSQASLVLVVSLVVTLVVMAVVSVLFVYRRNDAARREMMSERVSSMQTLLQQECEGARSLHDLDTPAFSNVLRMVADMSRTDVSLFGTDGKVFKSTIPELYDRMLVSSRINQKAFDNIVYRNRRYYIHRESIGHKRYMAMYAPLFGSEGQMLAIMSSPFVEESNGFQAEAVMHLISMFTVFLILLLFARVAIETIVDRIFQPLVEMGRKMNEADLDKLEYIEYDRDDEITSLVTAYNRMVHDLTESSQKLAQAERDRAWSAMARQVAHEIKNPMTPMKLNIQRVIRLKEKNDPAWQERFDECMKVVLDHIDILTDTANQFSDFAKLYTEEPTLVDLDKLLQEEIAMFDNREGIEFTYMGLGGAMAMAPKPQLVRVFVNILTNSIQAIEASRQEQRESGAEPQTGRILVSLRKSSSGEDNYDIVFEDNGPGVSEENRDKLFTPNFTTKTSGTGLGLAICHNILQKCDATITYSRSFSLGGACFTIVYPGYRG